MPIDKIPLKVVYQGPVCRIVMHRINKKNALNGLLYNSLIKALEAANTDSNIRVVLLTGAGDIFSSGNDLDDFMKLRHAGSRPGTAFIAAISRFHKPLVAAVNGPAIGIGSTMLLHCDLVFAAESARFQMPFVNLGLCPEAGSTYLLPRNIGHQLASEILLLGRPFGARKAQAMGLVNMVCPDDNVVEKAMEAARELAAKPLKAILTTKALLKAGGRLALEETITNECQEFTEQLASTEFEAAYADYKARLKDGKKGM